MPKVGNYVSVSYALADAVDDDRRSPTYGEVTKWKPAAVLPAAVLAVNADGTLELAVYDNEPTPSNNSHLLGGISNAKPGADLNQWFQE